MMRDIGWVRSALFLPASNARAIEKARGLACDMVLFDLEDAVKAEDKARARAAAVEAVAGDYGGRPLAIRLNGAGTGWQADDIAAVRSSRADFVVAPKVESAADATRVAQASGKPLLTMIETPAGLLAASAIAAVPGVQGLIAGTNDIAAALRLPPGEGRAGLTLALQTIVLAARAHGALALDGVWNRLDDPEGFEAECREGRAFGFDGKTLIHPNQIAAANTVFAPDAAEVEEARALIAAATGGAERFRGRMIEGMHVESARRLLAMEEAGGSKTASLPL